MVAWTNPQGALRAESIMHRHAFTLIEILMVVMVIAILAAIIVPAASNTHDDTAITATMTDMLALERAIRHYHARTGEWPEETKPGVFPSELTDYLRPDDFTKDAPIGGKFDWNFKQAGATASIAVWQAHVDAKTYTRLDQQYDDGNLKTGSIVQQGNGLTLILAQ